MIRVCAKARESMRAAALVERMDCGRKGGEWAGGTEGGGREEGVSWWLVRRRCGKRTNELPVSGSSGR